MDTTEQDLAVLCAEAEGHAKGANREAASAFFAAASATWERLDAAGAHGDLRRRFEEARTAFEERLEHERIRRERTSAREALCAEVEGLAAAEDALEQAGRIHALRNAWQEQPPVPPQYLEILQARFDRALQAFAETVEAQRRERELKAERMPEIERLCARAEALAEGSEWIQAEKELKDIRKHWLQLVAGLGGMEAVHGRFEQALAGFARRKEELAQTLAAELELLRRLCGELEACLQAEDLKSVRAQVKEIASRWKVSEIRDAAKEELQRHFRTMLNAYHRKIHEIFEEEEWGRWENYTIKVGLCEKAERLPGEASFSLRFRLLKELQEQWKRIGPVPREKSDEIWDRFHRACQATYEACRAFFDEQAKVRAEALRAKLALCEQAEALRESDDWEPAAEALKALQAEWRGLGNALRGKDKEEAASQRFRAACNAFFERRKAHYAEVHRVQGELRKARQALCEEAHALREAADPVACIGAAMDLRRRWREGNPAARGDEHHLWHRFNGALNAFFARLDQMREDNHRRREEICAEVERLADGPDLAADCDAVADAVRALEAEWQGLGPSPRDKGRELDDRFRALMRRFADRYHEARRGLASAFAANLAAREALLDEMAAFALASAATDAEALAAAAVGFEARWAAAAPVSREAAEGLGPRLAEAIAALKAGDVGHFRGIAARQQEGLEAKRRLCEELEELAGLAAAEAGEDAPADLAKELLMAIEGNFGLGDGGNEAQRRETHERFARICAKWERTGPVPAGDRAAVEARFGEACAAFRKRHGEAPRRDGGHGPQGGRDARGGGGHPHHRRPGRR